MRDVAVITGGANGIGKEIAYTYFKEGYTVVIADHDPIKGEIVKEEIVNQGGTCLFVETDVRNPVDIENLFETVVNTFGTINILINNAGVSKWKSVYELTLNEWEDVLNTNLRSVFLSSREAAKYMKQNEKGGSIVNIASTRALMSEKNSEAYAASKGGIVSITHALASSLSEDNITVNAISPGWIETGEYSNLRLVDHDQHFSKRVGKPADIARACVFLTKPDNNFITGENLVIDGGMTKKMIYEH
jgi:NAD(P)-dependent dehydrogenase (short-subunit alcohol dehydrogenase family)